MEAKYVVRLTFNQAAELHDAYEQMRIRMCKRKKRKNKTEKKWKKKKWQRALYPDDTPRDFRAGDLFQPKHVKALYHPVWLVARARNVCS